MSDDEDFLPLDDAPDDDGQMPGQLAVPVPGEKPKRIRDKKTPVGEELGTDQVKALATFEGRIDWDRPKRMYVEGIRRHDPRKGAYTHWPTYREVGRLCGLNETQVANKGVKNGWMTSREMYKAQVEQKRLETRARNQAEHSNRIEKTAISASAQGLELVLLRVEEIAEQQRNRKARGTGTNDDDEFEVTVDGRELETLGRAAATWHALSQKVLGISETHKVQLSGPNGGPLDIRASVTEEMRRDDPDRLYGFLIAAERSGLLGPGMLDAIEADGPKEIEA
ncbi:MAG: hypothetical protein NVS3B1_29400 [Marmoricola sp.]